MKKTKMTSYDGPWMGSTDISGWDIPIYEALKAYTASDPLPFHMPGHKLGKGIPDEFLERIEKLDLTEIPGTDNLHMPSGAIMEAQELAARAFGARKTFFLVNGSTVGLHAVIAAMCRPGQQLIVGRDCHKAVINGMLLSGVTPYYILPEYSEEFGINTAIKASAVEEALDKAPGAAGVLITRPNYYGVCCDIQKIAQIVHSRGKLLAVDEAHGSHLAFSRRLPACALEAGADICVQSAHKTLPAFTQGAYLHVGSERIDAERLRYFLDIYQTTSPSYILLAFLDIAREIMQKRGEQLLDGLLDVIEEESGKRTADGLKLLNGRDMNGFEHDDTRIVLNTSGLGISGYSAEKLLRERLNIQVEMSDLNNIVCIATTADDSGSIERLFSGFMGLGAACRGHGVHHAAGRPDLNKFAVPGERAWPASSAASASPAAAAEPEAAAAFPALGGLELPRIAMGPDEILNARFKKIPLKNAAGEISREIISPYPPGIAAVCPGEIFEGSAIELLEEILRCGGIVQGVDENGCVAVVK